MSLLTLIILVALIVIGLWATNKFVKTEPIKQVLSIILIVILIIIILILFGVISFPLHIG